MIEMDAGWYLLSDGSKKYWNGVEWHDVEPLSAPPSPPVPLDRPVAPPGQANPSTLTEDAPPPPTRAGGKSRMFALLSLGLVVANAFFPPGLLENPSWIWERLSYMSAVDYIAPWYTQGFWGLISLGLWWIGMILAFIFASVRNRAGALVGVSIAALVAVVTVVRFLSWMFDIGFWEWDLGSQFFLMVDVVSLLVVFSVAIVMAARLAPAMPGAPIPAHAPGASGKTNSLAIASMVSSILTLWIVGIVLGHIALRQIRRTGEGGRGMALAGVIVGYVGWALGLVLLVVFYQWWYSL